MTDESRTDDVAVEEEDFSAAAPPHPAAAGTGETSFGDAEVPAASELKVAQDQAEKQVKDLGEQIDSASKSEIESAIAAVNEAVKGEDAEDIRAKTDTLQTAFHRVSEAMYERAQAAQPQDDAGSENGASASNGDSSSEEEVVDAEVVDEQK